MLTRKKVNFRSLADLNELVVNALPTLPKDLTLVVGVPRSGCLVGSLIALYLNIPLCSFNEYLKGSSPSGGRRIDKVKFDSQSKQKVLVVDDSTSSGWEISRLREQFADSGITHETIFLVAYASTKAKDLVDIALEVINPPQIFEWNCYHHHHLQNSCVDIDGVLCRDATKEEDDDGIRYRKFLEHVEPRIIPTTRIGWLVTSRLEKYRDLTEAWLRKHGIEYDHLIMQDLPDLAARRKSKSDAKFKSRIYSNIGKAFFFIESSAWQAEEIASRTKKAVFCVDNGKFTQAKVLEGKGWDLLRSSAKAISRAGKRISPTENLS